MKKITLTSLIIVMCMSLTYSQKTKQDSTYRKFYVGSSAFILLNLNTSDPNAPDFGQLNFGYRISPKDVISLEAKTWKYAWPLGIPYGKSYEAPEEKYPGHVKAFGIGLVYQHFWWKGAYTSIDAGNMLQKYIDEDNKHIQNGYQLFMTYRLGYQFQFFKNRFFIEPSVAITHWPINTNVPESFAIIEDKWPNYFLFEPGLHFGVKF
ncbi:MAG: hypothetical protein HOO86_08865 [Bacteroidales bacterium]|nr:hypothetical protein [Bacteroidales bacterium]